MKIKRAGGKAVIIKSIISLFINEIVINNPLVQWLVKNKTVKIMKVGQS